jgi:hypothetical protein
MNQIKIIMSAEQKQIQKQLIKIQKKLTKMTELIKQSTGLDVSSESESESEPEPESKPQNYYFSDPCCGNCGESTQYCSGCG